MKINVESLRINRKKMRDFDGEIEVISSSSRSGKGGNHVYLHNHQQVLGNLENFYFVSKKSLMDKPDEFFTDILYKDGCHDADILESYRNVTEAAKSKYWDGFVCLDKHIGELYKNHMPGTKHVRKVQPIIPKRFIKDECNYDISLITKAYVDGKKFFIYLQHRENDIHYKVSRYRSNIVEEERTFRPFDRTAVKASTYYQALCKTNEEIVNYLVRCIERGIIEDKTEIEATQIIIQKILYSF